MIIHKCNKYVNFNGVDISVILKTKIDITSVLIYYRIYIQFVAKISFV